MPVTATGKPVASMPRTAVASKRGRISIQRAATAAPRPDESASAANAPARPKARASVTPSTRCSAAVPVLQQGVAAQRRADPRHHERVARTPLRRRRPRRIPGGSADGWTTRPVRLATSATAASAPETASTNPSAAPDARERWCRHPTPAAARPRARGTFPARRARHTGSRAAAAPSCRTPPGRAARRAGCRAGRGAPPPSRASRSSPPPCGAVRRYGRAAARRRSVRRRRTRREAGEEPGTQLEVAKLTHDPRRRRHFDGASGAMRCWSGVIIRHPSLRPSSRAVRRRSAASAEPRPLPRSEGTT